VSPRLCGENNWLIWQLMDSAFPTGGFAHSAGLEAAAQNGEIRGRADLRAWLTVSLQQIGRAALPLVNTTHGEPDQLQEADAVCDVFTTNHVANRASRLQGRAFQLAVERVFKCEFGEPLEFGHLAPVFGCAMNLLGVDVETTRRLFVFQHLRGVVAAAVRLNLVGPMEGQVIQFEMATDAESVVMTADGLCLNDLAQTAPLLDLWQGTQDRLYSRLFQS
jgi:urease accessory protein